eukprot:1591942-Rhodomonas_salina.1
MLSSANLLLIITLLSVSSSAAFVSSPFQLRQLSKSLSQLRIPQQNVCKPPTPRSCCKMGQSTGQQESTSMKEAGSKNVIKGILFDIDGTLFDRSASTSADVGAIHGGNSDMCVVVIRCTSTCS